MIFKKEKIQKFISSILVVLILAPSFLFLAIPKNADATGVPVVDAVSNAMKAIGNIFLGQSATANTTNTWLKIREVAKAVLQETLKAIARRALAEMTKSTVNWINTGFHGMPLFLERPDSFFQNVGKSEIKELVTLTGYDSGRFPFGKNYLLGLIGDYNRQLSDNLAYSMSKVTNDPYELQRYRVDFAYGGWDGLMLTTQYPQNNVIGYEMSASQTLATNINSATQKIDKALQQGQGFLSPTVCKTNPNLKDMNPFDIPTFDPNTVPNEPPEPIFEGDPFGIAVPTNQNEIDAYARNRENQLKIAQKEFEARVRCPGGYETTTPGSVVASKIIKSMNQPEEQGSLSAAFGNSLATVFDALLNKFIGDGLNSLAKRVTPGSNESFSYYGETLGGSDSETPWSGMPDQEIVLDDFKKEISGKTIVTDLTTGIVTQEDVGDTCAKATPPSYCSTPGASTYIPGVIANTALELQLIDNPDPNNRNPGIIQVLDGLWPIAKHLDMCVPGPNKDWEKRLEEERDRVISTKIIIDTSNDESLKVRASRDAIRELKIATTSFKDWVNTKMITSGIPGSLGLPSSALFLDAIKELDTNDQEYKQILDKKREKVPVLAKLNAIESSLSSITTQPAVGSLQEKNLISIRRQYDALAGHTANEFGIESLRSQLDLLKERKQNLMLLDNQCVQERATAGWTSPVAGGLGILPSKIGNPYWKAHSGRSSSSLTSNVVNSVINPVGTVAGALFGGSSNAKDWPEGLYSDGSELVEFCKAPIVNGYSHGEVIRPDESNRPFENTNNYFTFRNLVNKDGLPGYTDLPILNAYHYYGDYEDGFPVNVDIDCKLLFKTNDNDYKHAGDAQY